MPIKALVTGGAGFIGSHVVDGLLARGETVRVLDNFSTGTRANLEHLKGRIEIIEGDLRDEAAVKRAVEGVQVIFHLACVPSVPRSIAEPIAACDINVVGGARLYDAARKAGVRRVVFSGSSSVYGETPELPKRESMLPRPLSPYAVVKLAVEHLGQVYTRIYGLQVVGLRYFNVFGPRQDPKSDYAAVIPRFMRSVFEGKAPTIYGTGEQTRDFTFVSDVVAANLLAAEKMDVAGETFNIAGGRQTTINDIAHRVAALAGSSLLPNYQPARPGDVLHSHAAITQAQTRLGWRPEVSLEDGLKKTWEWFRTQWQRTA